VTREHEWNIQFRGFGQPPRVVGEQNGGAFEAAHEPRDVARTLRPALTPISAIFSPRATTVARASFST
jgi:hypothetical protein